MAEFLGNTKRTDLPPVRMAIIKMTGDKHW